LLNGERWELIEGELLKKMPKKRSQVQALAILTEWLIATFPDCLVNAAAPMDVAPEDNPTNEPSPDLIVLRPDYGDPWTAVPQAQDVLLAVEVCDTTLEFHSRVKAGLYARVGLREYWVVDLNGQRAGSCTGRRRAALPVDSGLRRGRAGEPASGAGSRVSGGPGIRLGEWGTR
jgi:Uma2 family endonuclease